MQDPTQNPAPQPENKEVDGSNVQRGDQVAFLPADGDEWLTGTVESVYPDGYWEKINAHDFPGTQLPHLWVNVHLPVLPYMSWEEDGDKTTYTGPEIKKYIVLK